MDILIMKLNFHKLELEILSPWPQTVDIFLFVHTSFCLQQLPGWYIRPCRNLTYRFHHKRNQRTRRNCDLPLNRENGLGCRSKKGSRTRVQKDRSNRSFRLNRKRVTEAWSRTRAWFDSNWSSCYRFRQRKGPGPSGKFRHLNQLCFKPGHKQPRELKKTVSFWSKQITS